MASHRRFRAAWLVALAACCVVSLTPALAGGERPSGPVTLAEVASRVPGDATHLGNVVDLLRRDVEAELGAIDWTRSGVQRRAIVSASLVQLRSSRNGRLHRAHCTVSATVRDAKSGALLAMLEGRADAEQNGGAVGAERDALSGAARGAVTAIPEAMRRAR